MRYRTLNSFLTGSAFNIFGVVVSSTRLATFITGICCLIILHSLIYKTRLGLKIRAVSQHKDATWAYGVNVQSVSLFTFALSGAMAGISGVLMGLITSVNPVAGFSLVLFAFPIMVLAGFGEILGVIVVGIIIGLTESIISILIGQQFRIVAVYSLLLILFLIRPHGLFARESPT
jgi:branched-chain amino acid transport system permease protein